MKKFLVILVFFLGFNSCIDTPYNPNTPDVYINFEIYPNSTMYYELNTIAGWMYVNAPWPSRGIIIFRHPSGEFKAYERQSPNEPDYCGESSRLIVDSPFVVDTCLDVYCSSNGAHPRATLPQSSPRRQTGCRPKRQTCRKHPQRRAPCPSRRRSS